MMQREDGPIPEAYALWRATNEDGVRWSVYGKSISLQLLIECTAIGMSSQTHAVGCFFDAGELQIILTNLEACPNLKKRAVVSSQMRWEWGKASPCWHSLFEL
jgi:hypothetical protein